MLREEGLSPTAVDSPVAEGRAGAGLSPGRAEPGEPGSSQLGTVTSLPAVSSGCFSQKNLILTKRDDPPPRAPKSRCVPWAAEQQLPLGVAGAVLPPPPLMLQRSILAPETGQRPGEHAHEVHPTLHPLHQTQRDQETPGLGGEQVTGSPQSPGSQTCPWRCVSGTTC